MWSSVREWWAAWDGRFAAADPAHQRFRLGMRAAVSLALAIGVMDVLATAGHQPVTVTMLAGIVAMTTATSVKDGTRRAALETLGGALVVSVAVVAVAASLHPHPLAADVAFVAVMTGGVLLRRWGQRGFALGQLAFMTYFFVLFLQATEHQLGWLALAVAVGSACTAVVRVLVLPDRPAADLRRSLRSLQARLADLADEVRLWLAATPVEREAERTRLLVRAGSRLDEVALVVERKLENAEEGVADVEAVRGLVFDLEVAAEHLSDVVRERGPALSPRLLARLTARAGRLAVAARTGRAPEVTRQDALAAIASEVTVRRDDVPALAEAFERVEEALGRLAAVTVTAPRLEGYVGPATAPAGGASGGGGAAAGHGGGLSLSTRTAVQVAIAGSLAIVAGKQISSARWFWAVLAAYVVFINASTSTASLRRAVARVVGTVGGVAAGLALGNVVTGDDRLAVALILVLVFAAFWFVQVSYTGLVFCFTLTLAALYSVLGMLSWSLMWLRIEETVAGAVIGGLVALLVLPRRGRDAIDEDVDRVLAAAGEVLDRLRGDPDPLELRAVVRTLDQRFQDLRTTIRPTIIGVPGAVPRSRRRMLLHVAGVRYWTRTLAVVGEPLDADRLDVVSAHLQAVRDRVAHRPAPSWRPSSEGPTPLVRLDEALAALVDAPAERSAEAALAS